MGGLGAEEGHGFLVSSVKALDWAQEEVSEQNRMERKSRHSVKC